MNEKQTEENVSAKASPSSISEKCVIIVTQKQPNRQQQPKGEEECEISRP